MLLCVQIASADAAIAPLLRLAALGETLETVIAPPAVSLAPSVAMLPPARSISGCPACVLSEQVVVMVPDTVRSVPAESVAGRQSPVITGAIVDHRDVAGGHGERPVLGSELPLT